MSVLANPNNANALKELKEKYAMSIYVEQADLLMAKQAISQSNYQNALNYLLPLINSTNEFIAQSAKFRASSVYLEINNADKALNVLGDNTNKEFSALYNHAKGDAYFSQNNINSAKEYYHLALSQLSDDSKLKNLIKIKLNDLN